MRRRGHLHLAGSGLSVEDARSPPPGELGSYATELVARLAGGAGFERGDLLAVPVGFGRGLRSDRASLAFAAAGVGGLLGASLPPVFREACHRAGVPTLDVPGLASFAGPGDDLIVDFRSGTLENVSRRKMHLADGLQPALVRLIAAAPAISLYGLPAQGARDPDVWEPGQD